MSAVTTLDPAAQERAPRPSKAVPRTRLESIDLLRGVAMAMMALDHTRDFFSNAQFSPADLDKTTPALFFTRWVTHFCAPAFIFLAGTAVYLSARKGKTRGELARFLLVRGAWLIFLEVTILRFAMVFSFDYHFVSFTVLWAIGWSMIALAGLIYLPTPAVAAFGIVMIFGHNLLDGFEPTGPVWVRSLWAALHGPPQSFPTRLGVTAHVLYPLIPWIGVMAAGYGFGSVMALERPQRRKLFFTLGTALIAAFVLIRALNVYGDPEPWTRQATHLFTVLSFLNCAKYPPSLDFLLMTLGPCLLVLTWFDRDWEPGGLDTWLMTYGRVPLFFFLLHWMLIHALAVVVALMRGQSVGWLFRVPPFDAPSDYGYDLPMVYLMWGIVVVSLYPVCRWFADLKRRRKDWWLSYF